MRGRRAIPLPDTGAGGWVVYADFGPFTRYFRTDHLGPISAITNEAAQYLHTASYTEKCTSSSAYPRRIQ
jgi:hypothetical protein